MSTVAAERNYLDELRGLFSSEFTSRSWARLEEHFSELGLPWKSSEGAGKARFVDRYLKELPDDEVIRIAHWYLANESHNSSIRRIEDQLEWLKSKGTQRLSEITRRSILEALENRRLVGRLDVAEFINLAGIPSPYDNMTSIHQGESSLYTENLFFGLYSGPSPRTPLSNTQFLKDCGFLAWPDSRVLRTIEALVAPSVREGNEQDEWIDILSPILKIDGYRFEQRDTISGRPVFQLVGLSEGVVGRPKNLIFASTGPKPEIGFADAINNDIVVLKHAESCLIYDRRLSDSGLLWSELVVWWAELNDLSGDLVEARKSLGNRLLQSFQSEPERTLFKVYFKQYLPKLRDRLPALIPQVYLHYDPKTLKELQGRKRIPRQRMDFLLLLERGSRVVLEIDGLEHYTNNLVTPSPEKYAEMVQADRSLRLAGYEVYRFGGRDFTNNDIDKVLIDFFDRLFSRHGINTQ